MKTKLRSFLGPALAAAIASSGGFCAFNYDNPGVVGPDRTAPPPINLVPAPVTPAPTESDN